MKAENSDQSVRVRPDPSLELARQRAELLGLPPPPEPRVAQDNTIPSSPPPSYEHVLAEVSHNICPQMWKLLSLSDLHRLNLRYSKRKSFASQKQYNKPSEPIRTFNAEDILCCSTPMIRSSRSMILLKFWIKALVKNLGTFWFRYHI